MTSSHFLGTAEVLNNGTSVACSRPSSELTPTTSSRLLNRLVALTERGHGDEVVHGAPQQRDAHERKLDQQHLPVAGRPEVVHVRQAQDREVLAAEAQARFGGMEIAGPGCFVNDAAGGGSRSVEAARSLRAQANLR